MRLGRVLLSSRRYAAVSLIFVACNATPNAPQAAASATVAVVSAPTPPATERVSIAPVPLELGVGDSRDRLVEVWPADGTPSFTTPSGTRVQRLDETRRTHRPITVPACEEAADGCVARIFIATGDHAGAVGYVPFTMLQVAR
jgi:hypothetical protein